MSTATTTASVGDAIVMPAALTFLVTVGDQTGTVTIKGHETKSGVTYRGSKRTLKLRDVSGEYHSAHAKAGDGVDQTLESTGVILDGVGPLNVGEVHTSAPWIFPATITRGPNKGQPHPQAGQAKAGTGGQRTIRHSLVAKVHGQFSTIFLTITKVNEDGVDKGYTASGKVMPRVIGGSPAEVDGFDELDD